MIVRLHELEDLTKLCAGLLLDASYQKSLLRYVHWHPPEACINGRNWLSLLSIETKVLQRWPWRNTGSLIEQRSMTFSNREIFFLLFRQSSWLSTGRMNKISDFKTNWPRQKFLVSLTFDLNVSTFYPHFQKSVSVTSQGRQGYYIKLVLNTSGSLISLLKLLANVFQTCFCVT